MNAITSSRSLNTDLAALFLRLLVGCLFIYHGYPKMMAYNETVAKFPDIIGIGSELSLILVIFAEVVCGFLVAIGFLTRLAIIPMFIVMVVAYFIAHGNDPFQAKTLPFVYMILCIIIYMLGSGKYSVDGRNRSNSVSSSTSSL